MRLWSSVVSQLDTRPCERVTPAGGRATLTATRASLVEALLQVGDRRVELPLRPALADRGHLPGAVPDDVRDPLAVREQRVGGDVRADVALSRKAVALRADALEGLLAEVGGLRLALLNPHVVVL